MSQVWNDGAETSNLVSPVVLSERDVTKEAPVFPPIALDLTRLFIAPTLRTPRGIDRVELAYAKYFLPRWPGDIVITIPGYDGIRCFGRDYATRLVTAVERHWREIDDAESDPFFHTVVDALSPGSGHAAGSLRKPSHGPIVAFAALLRECGMDFGQRVDRGIPANAIYINVGHWRMMLGWLDKRPDVTPIFMVHDTIPLDYPEFVQAPSVRHHAKIIEAAGRFARGLILTTDVAASSVNAALRAVTNREIPAFAAGLPLSPHFYERQSPDARLVGKPYFLVCGSIEPRKNHALLFAVWRELVTSLGADAPVLVVVGNRNVNQKSDTAILDRGTVLANHVIEVANLSTPALKILMTSARAVLMPSFAEGFGLPVAEALACGTPVIASSIPAHREVGGDFATYRSPIDGIGWMEAIQAHLDPDVQASARSRLTAYRPMTSDAYFERVTAFLHQMKASGLS